MNSSRRHPFLRLCLCALGLVAIQALFGGLLTGVAVVVAKIQGVPDKDVVAKAADAMLRYALPIQGLLYPFLLLFISRCRHKLDRASVASLGLRPIRFTPELLRGVLSGTLAIALLWGILWLTGGIQVTGWSEQAKTAGLSALIPLIGFAMLFGATGVYEELLFRGYALHNLSAWLGWRTGLILQAILFAAVHLPNATVAIQAGTPPEKAWAATIGAMPSIALVGILFALSARKTGALWYAIGFHGAWNFALGCIFSMPVSGTSTFHLLDVQAGPNTWLSGGSFGAEGSFLLIPILLALIYFMSQAPDHPQTLLDLELSWDARPLVAPQPQLASQPQVAATSMVSMEDEEPTEEPTEEPRENRYRARFGAAEGFDSDMLRELRSMQQQRDRDAAEREAAQRERENKERELKGLELDVKTAQTPNVPSLAKPSPVTVENAAEPMTNPPVESTTPVTPAQAPVSTRTAATSSSPSPVSSPPTTSTEPSQAQTPQPTPAVTSPAPQVKPTPPKPASPITAPPTPAPAVNTSGEAPPAPPKPIKKASPRW